MMLMAKCVYIKLCTICSSIIKTKQNGNYVEIRFQTIIHES